MPVAEKVFLIAQQWFELTEKRETRVHFPDKDENVPKVGATMLAVHAGKEDVTMRVTIVKRVLWPNGVTLTLVPVAPASEAPV